MSVIDGRRVTYRGRPDWEGIVMGDGHAPDTVRVDWRKPKVITGTHQLSDLELIAREEPAVE